MFHGYDSSLFLYSPVRLYHEGRANSRPTNLQSCGSSVDLLIYRAVDPLFISAFGNRKECRASHFILLWSNLEVNIQDNFSLKKFKRFLTNNDIKVPSQVTYYSSKTRLNNLLQTATK